jgi:hypothetical protein
MTGFIILVIVLLGAGAFIVQQTKAKGRWGLGSMRGVNCPRCGTRLPVIRRPATKEQMMWGGWTCPQCGCKVDKYGREIAS